MADTHFPDEWLARSLEGVVTPELLVELREKAPPPARLWETLVAQKIASDDQILAALSTRFRLKVADLANLDPAAKERVPEQVARRYQILPLRATDSYLEVATANPFDLDAEKALAFATAREIRMFLLAPSKIAERLDELYRPEKAVDKLLEGMENSTSLEHLQDVAPDELVASEAEASQRPVVRLVDLIISEGILARSSDIDRKSTRLNSSHLVISYAVFCLKKKKKKKTNRYTASQRAGTNGQRSRTASAPERSG